MERSVQLFVQSEKKVQKERINDSSLGKITDSVALVKATSGSSHLPRESGNSTAKAPEILENAYSSLI